VENRNAALLGLSFAPSSFLFFPGFEGELCEGNEQDETNDGALMSRLFILL
jgi:hypothetical protein